MENRFKLEKSVQPNKWVCTDTENKIVCVFENHRFNDTQQFTPLEHVNHMSPTQLARTVNEMGDWLFKNHYNKIF